MTDKPTYADWQQRAAKEVKSRDLTWHTPEGIAIKPLYTAEDTADLDSGLPGFAPFTRGPYASMYTGRYVSSVGSYWNFQATGIMYWTMGDYLREHGYRTALVGKTHSAADKENMQRLGISAETAHLCDQIVSIPMIGTCDSLNLAVATSVMLYEVFHQTQ